MATIAEQVELDTWRRWFLIALLDRAGMLARRLNYWI